MADFGGWLMPIEYPGAGVLAEHAAVRERVGLFDVSHLGKSRVTGVGALDFLNSQFTNDLNRITDSKAQYTLYCTPEGGVIDDLIVYRNSAEDFFLIPNALIANSASSLTLFPVYKMYQNGVFENMDGPFFEYETEDELEYAKTEDKDSEKAKTLLKKFQTSQGIIAMDYYKKYKDNGGESDNFQWVYYRQRLLNNVITLKPNETKTYTIKTLWNKNRYIKNDDLEFYLDENNTIEIELILDLKTNLFKDQLTKEDLQKINENPNFIRGLFTSNKMKIEFKD